LKKKSTLLLPPKVPNLLAGSSLKLQLRSPPDPSILEVEPLDENLDDVTTLSNLMKKVDKQKQVLNGIIEA
jgi:hypothetical protein